MAVYGSDFRSAAHPTGVLTFSVGACAILLPWGSEVARSDR
jgi:hypothetical protein